MTRDRIFEKTGMTPRQITRTLVRLMKKANFDLGKDDEYLYSYEKMNRFINRSLKEEQKNF